MREEQGNERSVCRIAEEGEGEMGDWCGGKRTGNKENKKENWEDTPIENCEGKAGRRIGRSGMEAKEVRAPPARNWMSPEPVCGGVV